MIVLLNLAINMSSMKHLWGVISRITQPATYESINDEGVISLNRDRLQSKEITYIYIYSPNDQQQRVNCHGLESLHNKLSDFARISHCIMFPLYAHYITTISAWFVGKVAHGYKLHHRKSHYQNKVGWDYAYIPIIFLLYIYIHIYICISRAFMHTL